MIFWSCFNLEKIANFGWKKLKEGRSCQIAQCLQENMREAQQNSAQCTLKSKNAKVHKPDKQSSE